MNAARARLLACVLANAAPALCALREARPSTVTIAIALSFLPYAWLVAHSDELTLEQALSQAKVGALLSGAALLLAPPVLSDDLYRYLWDGRVLSHGIDPYAYAPSDPALFALRDRYYEQINHREIATIYPPLAQLLFALSDLVVHAPLAPKLLAFAAHFSCIGVIARLAQREPARAVLSFALNPLALEETALHGHIDAVCGLALLLAVLALSEHKRITTALALALATGTKLVGLLLVPFTARLGLRTLFLSAGLSLCVLLPLARHAGAEQSGVNQYARRWQGNAALFTVFEGAISHALEQHATPADRARGHVRVASLEPLLRALSGTPLDPWASVRAEHKHVPDPTDFEIPFLAGLLTRALVVGLVFCTPWLLLWWPSDLVWKARATLLTALLCAPQIHPWYLLWLLPLEAVLGRNTGFAWSATILIAYAPLDLWQRARIWNEWRLAILCEFGVVALVLACDAWVFKRVPGAYAGLPSLPTRARSD